MPGKSSSAIDMFAAKGAEKVYRAVVSGIRRRVGASMAVVDPKQTCVHITAGKGGTAYMGLHPRKGAVLLTICMDAPIRSLRVRKAVQGSRRRCYCDVLVGSMEQVDEELIDWMQHAAMLVSGKAANAAKK